jgi:hypothetical protein
VTESVADFRSDGTIRGREMSDLRRVICRYSGARQLRRIAACQAGTSSGITRLCTRSALSQNRARAPSHKAGTINRENSDALERHASLYAEVLAEVRSDAMRHFSDAEQNEQWRQ